MGTYRNNLHFFKCIVAQKFKIFNKVRVLTGVFFFNMGIYVCLSMGFLQVDACVQGMSLSHIIIATASCCFSSLLWPAPVRLLNRVSSPLKTWATLVPPSKTLRGTTLLLFIHSALKMRSDNLTPPYLQTVHWTQTVALLTACFHSFFCFLLRSLHVVVGINVTSLKSSKIVLNVLWYEPVKNVIANEKKSEMRSYMIISHKNEDIEALYIILCPCMHLWMCASVCLHDVCVSQVGMYHDPHGEDGGSSKENRMIFTESMPRRVGSFYRGKEQETPKKLHVMWRHIQHQKSEFWWARRGKASLFVQHLSITRQFKLLYIKHWGVRE